MGRKNHPNGNVQRSRLSANREERSSRVANAFALFRPVDSEVTEEVYERLHALQAEEDIPGNVKLFNRDLHSSIIQERRVRRGLAKGLATGFVLSSALTHIESGMPGHGRSRLDATITEVDVIGRNRNVLIAHLEDKRGVLGDQMETARHVLGSMGLKLSIDRKPHITLGESPAGLSKTERRHVIHTVQDTVMDVEVQLLPIMVEHNGRRLPLEAAKQL